MKYELTTGAKNYFIYLFLQAVLCALNYTHEIKKKILLTWTLDTHASDRTYLIRNDCHINLDDFHGLKLNSTIYQRSVVVNHSEGIQEHA